MEKELEERIVPGFKTHRLDAVNEEYMEDYYSKEVKINDQVQKEIKQNSEFLEQLVFGNLGPGLNKREENIVVSTLQWLGTPVGQSFLETCGFVYKKDLWFKRLKMVTELLDFVGKQGDTEDPDIVTLLTAVAESAKNHVILLNKEFKD